MKSVLCGVRSALSVSSTTQQCELYQRRHHQYASRTRAGHDVNVHMTSQAPAGHVTLRHTLPTDDSALTCVGLGVLHTVYGRCPVVSIFYLSIFSPSPNLSGRRLDVYHTSTHGVALMRI